MATMPLELTWHQIALRLALATLASLAIGYNRDEHGRPAGMRTVMLVTLTATLAMLQVNMGLSLAGKPAGSFVQLDYMRLPLGILSGIGFIGAGAIIKKSNGSIGVTTAATLWFTTMLGLLFGAGHNILGVVATALAMLILTGLKHVEDYIPRAHRGALTLDLSGNGLDEETLRARIAASVNTIESWMVQYRPSDNLIMLRCEVQWYARQRETARIPAGLVGLRGAPGVTGFHWNQ